MKKYNNFCITWIENGSKQEEIFFCKLDAIHSYINMLYNRDRDISSLAVYGVTKKYFELENLTGTVNRFLSN